jgi:hypothetical protein
LLFPGPGEGIGSKLGSKAWNKPILAADSSVIEHRAASLRRRLRALTRRVLQLTVLPQRHCDNPAAPIDQNACNRSATNRGNPMRLKRLAAMLAIGIATISCHDKSLAQSEPALTGEVRSQEEGPMAGVPVTATPANSTIRQR